MDKAARQQRQRDALAQTAAIERAVGRAFISPDGSDALKQLKKLFYDRPSYVKGDPYHTAFKEGQRDVVGYIIECIEVLEEAADVT